MRDTRLIKLIKAGYSPFLADEKDPFKDVNSIEEFIAVCEASGHNVLGHKNTYCKKGFLKKKSPAIPVTVEQRDSFIATAKRIKYIPFEYKGVFLFIGNLEEMLIDMKIWEFEQDDLDEHILKIIEKTLMNQSGKCMPVEAITNIVQRMSWDADFAKALIDMEPEIEKYYQNSKFGQLLLKEIKSYHDKVNKLLLPEINTVEQLLEFIENNYELGKFGLRRNKLVEEKLKNYYEVNKITRQQLFGSTKNVMLSDEMTLSVLESFGKDLNNYMVADKFNWRKANGFEVNVKAYNNSYIKMDQFEVIARALSFDLYESIMSSRKSYQKVGSPYKCTDIDRFSFNFKQMIARHFINTKKYDELKTILKYMTKEEIAFSLLSAMDDLKAFKVYSDNKVIPKLVTIPGIDILSAYDKNMRQMNRK